MSGFEEANDHRNQLPEILRKLAKYPPKSGCRRNEQGMASSRWCLCVCLFLKVRIMFGGLKRKLKGNPPFRRSH